MPRPRPKSGTPGGKKREALREIAKAADANYLPFDNLSPLSAIDGESAKAQQALTDYATMGVARSFEKLRTRYQAMADECRARARDPRAWDKEHPGAAEPIMPPTVSGLSIGNWSRDFLWVERVKRFDEIQAEVQRLEFETDRRAMKAERIATLKQTLTRLKAALVQLNPKNASWSEVVSGIRRVHEQMRIEMGEDQGVALDAGHARLLVVKLPAGVSGVAIEDDDDDAEADED
jgi:hypothetical protein